MTKLSWALRQIFNNVGGKGGTSDLGNVTSRIRMNYHPECEAHLNKQINLELQAWYIYQQLAFHFNRDLIALPGFTKYFQISAEDELRHAQKLANFQNVRGGRVVLKNIPKPPRQEWSSGLEALEEALRFEKMVNYSLIELQRLASKHDDANFAEFIESNFLSNQVNEIKRLSEMITNWKHIENDYIFDKHQFKDLK